MIVAMLIVFVHYFMSFYKQPEIFRAMVLLQEFVIGMAFLTICYLFCKNSSKILPGRKRWLFVIKVVAGVSFAIDVVIFFWQLGINKQDWDLCTTWFYVSMQTAQVFSVLISLVSGLYIRKSLLEMVPNSSAEKKFFLENQARAIRQIQIFLLTLTVYVVYNFAYSVTLRLFAPGCT